VKVTRDRRTELDRLPRVARVLATWEFERLVLDHPTIGLAIIRGLSSRLRSRTEQPHR
jgi:CRP-like cAMP-binding protein